MAAEREGFLKWRRFVATCPLVFIIFVEFLDFLQKLLYTQIKEEGRIKFNLKNKTMDIFVAAIVSLVVELIKRITGAKDWLATLILIIVSIVAAGLYSYLSAVGIWDKVVPILVSAAGIYNLFIQKLSK